MADDRPVPSDEVVDEVVEELRRCDPVDAAKLPSSHSTEAMRTLEQILDSDHDTGPEPGEASDSPAAGDRGR